MGMQLDERYADVRVVGGENMMEERPITEGLELFDTGVQVRVVTSRKGSAVYQCMLHDH